MKKKMSGFCLLPIFSALCLLFPLRAEASAGRIALKISGGLGYVEGGDINIYFHNVNNVLRSFSQNDKNFYPLHLGYEAQAEAIYRLSSRWKIGICSGFVQAKGSPNRLIRNYTYGRISFIFHTRITLIPVEARLYFTALSSPTHALYIHSGIGYNFSAWNNKSDYHFTPSDPSYEYNSSWEEEKAGAAGFSFRFGIGYELKLSGRLSFVAEGYGRLAKLAGFKGEKVKFDPSPTSETGIRSTLYYYEWNWANDSWISDIQIIGRPIGNGVRNVREASVDFSGLGLTIGLLIHL